MEKKLYRLLTYSGLAVGAVAACTGLVLILTNFPAVGGYVGISILLLLVFGTTRHMSVSDRGGIWKADSMYLEDSCVRFEATPQPVVSSPSRLPTVTHKIMRMSAWQAGLAASIVLFVLGLFWYF